MKNCKKLLTISKFKIDKDSFGHTLFFSKEIFKKVELGDLNIFKYLYTYFFVEKRQIQPRLPTSQNARVTKKTDISCVTWLENAQLSVSFITFKSFDKCLTYQDSPLQIIFSHNLIFYNKKAVTFPDAFYNTTDYMYDLIQKKTIQQGNFNLAKSQWIFATLMIVLSPLNLITCCLDFIEI